MARKNRGADNLGREAMKETTRRTDYREPEPQDAEYKRLRRRDRHKMSRGPKRVAGDQTSYFFA